jgi:hypothetical protein
MALERQTSPLPVGRYWIDIVTDDAFQSWVDWQKAWGENLKVEATEDFSEEGKRDIFVIFSVPKPGIVFWPQGMLGYPSKAPKSIKYREDTVQKPNVEVPDTADVLQGLITVGKITAVTVVGAVLLSLFRKR